jgi:hypothetical protein
MEQKIQKIDQVDESTHECDYFPLLGLPTEMIFLVFRQLPKMGDLGALSATCKSLNAHVKAFLLTKKRLRISPPNFLRYRTSGNNQLANITELDMSIISENHHRDFVKNVINAFPSLEILHTPTRIFDDMPEKHLRVIRKAIEICGVPRDYDSTKCNITSLYLYSGYHVGNIHYTKIHPKLIELKILSSPSVYDVKIDDTESISRLERLEFSHGELTLDKSFVDALEKNTSLVSLEGVNTGALNHIRFPALKTLHVADRVAMGLVKSHGPQLEELSITFPVDDQGHGDIDWKNMGKWDHLRNFSLHAFMESAKWHHALQNLGWKTECISLVNLRDKGPENPVCIFPRKEFPKLSTLMLSGFTIGSETVGNIFNRCPSLTRMSISGDCPPWSLPSSPSIKRIDINYKWTLKTTTIYPMPKLEDLHITIYTSSNREHIDLPVIAGACPALKEITVWCRYAINNYKQFIEGIHAHTDNTIKKKIIFCNFSDKENIDSSWVPEMTREITERRANIELEFRPKKK